MKANLNQPTQIMNMIKTTAYEVRVSIRDLNGSEEIDSESIVVDTLTEAKDIASYESDWALTLGAEVRPVLISDDRKISFRGALHYKLEGKFN